MEKEQPIIIKPFSETEIQTHAAKCGGTRNLREIVITTDENQQYVYLVKKPSRATLQAITACEAKKDIDGIQKLLLGCVLEGDASAYEYDGSIYTKLLDHISQLVNTSKAEIKKI